MTYEHILNFIDLNFVSDLTRDSVATTFGLSPAYISQLFHNIAGMTFSDYLCSCRINYAKQLLLNTRHPIKQIAVLCGYKDEVYFVRRFREIVGIPPGAYRNQCKQDT
jgi:YesN/AraC family two-component response regulator